MAIPTPEVTFASPSVVHIGHDGVQNHKRDPKMSPNERTTPRGQSLDLVESIKGLYRILDLITERGSGGLGSSSELPRKDTEF